MVVDPKWLYPNRKVKIDYFSDPEAPGYTSGEDPKMMDLILRHFPHYVLVPDTAITSMPDVVEWLRDNVDAWHSWRFPEHDIRARQGLRRFYCFATEDEALLFKLAVGGK